MSRVCNGEKDGWVTSESREFSGCSKMCNCSFQDTKSACVGVERTQEEKKKERKKKKGQKAKKIHQRLKGISLVRESQTGLYTERTTRGTKGG